LYPPCPLWRKHDAYMTITRNGKHFSRHFAVPSVIHLLTQPG
jgi:hypothetical protein